MRKSAYVWVRKTRIGRHPDWWGGIASRPVSVRGRTITFSHRESVCRTYLHFSVIGELRDRSELPNPKEDGLHSGCR